MIWPEPIDTAPKNQRILLYIPGLRRWEFGRWEEQKLHRKPKPYWRWCESVTDCRVYSPTHWLVEPKEPEGE